MLGSDQLQEYATNNQDDIDWSGVSENNARQILALGESYLKAQLQAAIAADQRAVTMTSILSATALAVVGASIAYFQVSKNVPTFAAAIATASVLLFAAACGAWAARPMVFWFPGNTPANWYDVRFGDFITNVGGEAENYSDRISWNNEILAANQSALMLGMVAAILSPVIGAVVWYFASI